jgi:sugar phosphate isomerase/epimerase
MMNRRTLLKAAVAAPALLPGASALAAPPAATNLGERLCLFTDHLDDSGYTFDEVARMMKQLGIAGPDLTVRPGGLVAPEKVTEDLPRAVKACRDQGLTVPMISTNLRSATDNAAETLRLAGKLGIRYYKLGYYEYEDASKWPERLEAVRRELSPLLKLGEQAGMTAGIHNHAGATVGGAMWDSWELLEPLDSKWVGVYFDPSHATVEGGNHGWKLGFHRVSSRLKMIALKDVIWEKTGGQWRTRWVPLGEGMVRWPEFFQLLARVPFPGPISLHIEYDPGGNNKADRFEKSFLAAERDLNFIRKQLKNAGLAP